MPRMADGLVALDAELAAAGITTAVLAQFWSWEGGMRAPDFARKLARTLAETRPRLRTDMHIQLRVETHMLDDYAEIRGFLAEAGIGYVVFNDHLPHARLAEGRRPPRLTGQALKSGRNPEAHLALMQRLHARSEEVPAALAAFAAELSAAGLRLGSHDDRTALGRGAARAMGLRIAEFPETEEAARAAAEGGDPILLGAPNVVRGASHAGNASARDLIAAGLCDALVSDYHYPSLRVAALHLAGGTGRELAAPWALLSARPAEILGWEDRGRLEPGRRADLTVLEAETGHVTATFCAGAVSFLAGPFAERLLA
jgi:alpha-D-ribose 1-methylphosphonate 5-triphosphate diphosphatase